MSDFDFVNNATVSDRLPDITPGRYVLEITGVKKVTSTRKGNKFFIIEAKTLESEGVGANEKGSSLKHAINMGKPSAGGNIVKFMAAALNRDAKLIKSELCDEAVQADQPLKGIKVRAEAFLTDTRAGGKFTLVNYAPVEATATKTAAKK